MTAHDLDTLDGLVAFLEAHGIDQPCWDPRYDRTTNGVRRCCCGHPLDHHHPSTGRRVAAHGRGPHRAGPVSAARPCSVVAGCGCRAPANGPRSTRATCFACGEPVCTDPDCSTIRPWHRYGRRRVCTDCSDQEARP